MNFQTWHITDNPNIRWSRGRDRQNTPPNNASMQSRLMLLFLMQILDVYHVTDAQTMGNTRHFGSCIKWYPCKFCSSTTTAQDTSGFSHSSLAVGPQGGSTWSQLHTCSCQTWSVPEQPQPLSYYLRDRVLYSPENCPGKCSIQYTKCLSCLSHKKSTALFNALFRL